jgi:dTDP-4-amino-4,6-dideoxygalactose transaminase
MNPTAGMIDLAIFGSAPAFSEKLSIGYPNIGDQDRLFERIKDILSSRWLTNNGPYVQMLEERIADLLGVKHCIAVCNATIGLEIAAQALGLHGEVIVPSFTFIATAHALKWLGIRPVFCDIDGATHNIDPGQIEKLITPRTSGILGVHVWGRPCAVEALREIAHGHQLKLFFDAAHAFGCSYQGKMIGNFGEAEVVSFHATKFFNTLEGGAILTNHDELAKQIRLRRNFGCVDTDHSIYVGTNGKMDEFSAAMGITLLESLDEIVEANYRNYLAYRQCLDGIPGIELISYDDKEKRNYQYLIIEVDEAQTHISRDQLIAILKAENVITRRYFYPGCHRMEVYRSEYPQSLPVTEWLSERVVALPTGPAIRQEQIRTICDIIRRVVTFGELVKAKLDQTGSGVYSRKDLDIRNVFTDV